MLNRAVRPALAAVVLLTAALSAQQPAAPTPPTVRRHLTLPQRQRLY